MVAYLGNSTDPEPDKIAEKLEKLTEHCDVSESMSSSDRDDLFVDWSPPNIDEIISDEMKLQIDPDKGQEFVWDKVKLIQDQIPEDPEEIEDEIEN